LSFPYGKKIALICKRLKTTVSHQAALTPADTTNGALS
jgi:hypothetical protein